MKATGDVPENDDFSAAGKQCQKLEGALATGDQAAVQSAAKDLRLVFSILGLPPSTPAEQLAALERKSAGLKGEELSYALPDLAKRSFNAGKVEKAEIYSKQLLQMASDYPHNWNHGNAVFSGNFVLGRIAVKKNQLNDAERYLLATAATEGSPPTQQPWPKHDPSERAIGKAPL